MESSRTGLPRRLSQRAQAAMLGCLIRLSRGLSPVRSSNLGGWIARNIGPVLPVSRIADLNLQKALPHLDAQARKHIIRAVWDNLGRNVGELPHLARFKQTADGPGWELQGQEHLEELIARKCRVLFFSGHFGNWEMVLPIAAQLGLPVAGFYRSASNAAVNDIIQGMRESALDGGISMFAKGARGARAALLHLKNGGSIGLLADQKMNDGIGVPFFGHVAMTAPALAQLALRFHAPVVPVHVVRLGAARFRMVCEPPLAVPLSGNKEADVYALTLAMNRTLERWITAAPESWLWLHRRWPKEARVPRPIHAAAAAEPANAVLRADL
jgi:Kdo2-lipid IVA lauroyltransferase/acyltransferase